MKRFIRAALLLSTLLLAAGAAFGQNTITQSQTFVTTMSGTVVQSTIPENSLYTTHTLNIVTTGTAVGTVQIQTCTTTLTTSCSNMTGSLAVSVATCTVTAPCTQTVQGQVGAFAAYALTLGTCTGCTVQVTYIASAVLPTGNLTDGFYDIPIPSGCGVAFTTGAFAANPANSGTQSAPAMVRVAANQNYLQTVSTAASNALTIDCDITPPFARTTTGKGVTVTGFTLYFGNQTTALTSITAPVVNTTTFVASGVGATTVATAGGALTFAPVSPFTAILATTVAGTCSALNVTFATPVLMNTANQLLGFTAVLNDTTGTANTYQICRVQVFYQESPF